jgi:PAS domain S-box-containing protein/diguanylate cyclase (GGDEF)-like protein
VAAHSGKVALVDIGAEVSISVIELAGFADTSLSTSDQCPAQPTLLKGVGEVVDACGMGVIAAPERWSILGEGLGSLLDEAVGPFVLLETDGRIVDCNRAAVETFGWTREAAVGAQATELLIAPDLRGECQAALERVVASEGAGFRRERVELRAMHCSGRELPIELALSAVDVGDRILCAAFLYDISERKQGQARQRRLEAVVASSGEAIVSASLEGMIESWNPAAERLFGYTAREMLGASVKRLLLDASFAGLGVELRALADGESVSLELPIRRKDGELVEVAVTVSPLCREDGEVAGVASIARDVTEHHRTAARLALANSRFAGAFQAASIGMALVSLDGRFLEVNPALCRLLARDAETLLASSFQELTHPDDMAASLEHLQRALAGQIETFQQSKRYLLPDGGNMWALLTLTIVRAADGAPLHFVAQIQDITARKTAEGELRRYATQLESLSEQDPLTGFSNRHAFEAALDAELGGLEAGGSGCSVLLAGIQGGDSVLVAAAESLQRASRDTDLVAHLGTGQLAVLLPGIDTQAAAAIAQRARDALASYAGTQFSYATASRGDTARRLMSKAREALASPEVASTITSSVQLPAGIGRLLDLARRQLGMPVSFLTHLDGDGHVVARVAGEQARVAIAEGDTLPLGDTHCQRMLEGRIGSTVTDLAAEAQTRDLDVAKRLGLRAYVGVPVRLRSGEIYGTLCAVDTQPHPELSARHTELLNFLSELAAELIEDEDEQRAARRAEAGATGVRTLLAALEARDFYTGEHSKQVVALASAVARKLGLDENATRDAEQVALLHDIGKVGIPDAILQKQGPLDDQEWQLMRQHPVVGERIIAGTPGLSHLAPAMRAEHERWDGSGYPDGLAGEQIPLASRITLACDALHAMTSDRPYRSAMTLQRARQELRACTGSQFDPHVIEALFAEIESCGQGSSILS